MNNTELSIALVIFQTVIAISIYICPQDKMESYNSWMITYERKVKIWLYGTTCLWYAGNI